MTETWTDQPEETQEQDQDQSKDLTAYVQNVADTVHSFIPDRLPVYLGAATLLVLEAVEPITIVAVAVGYEAFRRWNPRRVITLPTPRATVTIETEQSHDFDSLAEKIRQWRESGVPANEAECEETLVQIEQVLRGEVEVGHA